MEEYRVDIKVRNNLILTKMEEHGYPSALQFCEGMGLSYGRLMKFLNMRESIFDSKGNIKGFIYKLCDKLGCIPEELFSASQMEASMKDNKRSIKVGEAEVRFLLDQSNNQKLLEDNYFSEQVSERIENALDTLTLREKLVLEMRHGLGDYDREHTLEEIGLALSASGGCNRERVRQIEAKAMRKLRHPHRRPEIKLKQLWEENE